MVIDLRTPPTPLGRRDAWADLTRALLTVPNVTILLAAGNVRLDLTMIDGLHYALI